jgi:uncharacterized DUF497 family protein
MTSLRMTLRKHIMRESVMERHYLLVAAFRPRCATRCFTVRASRIRIISARKATRLEHKDYEEQVPAAFCLLPTL